MPCSVVKVLQRFGGKYCRHLQACCLAYSSTPKTKAVLSSETLVNFYQAARYYIPDDGTVLEIVYLLSIH